MTEIASPRKARLPNDVVGILEDRVADDRLDFAAYEELISKFKEKSKTDEARQTFERLLKVLPASAYVWRQYAEMETSANEFVRVEQIFNECLMTCLHVDIWSFYLDYIRRMNNLSTGGSQARSVISQAYEFVLQHVGIDIQAGPIWSDYITFLKSAPATSTWEEQQRSDLVRKTYQRAVVIPLNNVEALWRDYNTFENSINKQTARKFLNERSPAYMTARACTKELSAIIEPLRIAKFPSRPTRTPAEAAFVSGWRRWIAFEKKDPLALEDQAALRLRTKYAYKQCLMWCRFFPEMWYDSASYSESIGEESSGIYKDGLAANPKSWLLSFAYAEAEELARRNENVKTVYDNLINNNEEEIEALKADAQKEIDALEEQLVKSGVDDTEDSSGSSSDSDEEADAIEGTSDTSAKHDSSLDGIEKLKANRDKSIQELAEEGTVAAVMYMRALRRMEGIKAGRQSFAKAIKSPNHTWQIYVASALMEHQSSKETAIPIKIFARGLKSFPENTDYVLEYLNFLISIRDDTNARALFESTTSKMSPEKARPLFTRWYEYESMFGDLASAQKLALRMSETEPNSNPLTRFGQRFSYLGCDPIARRDIGLQKLSQVPQLLPPPPPIPLPVSRGLAPHPLAFPSIPGEVLPPPPGTNGFNPPIVRPDLQPGRQTASPIPPQVIPPPKQAAPVTPVAPPIHPLIMNLIRDLPPASSLNSIIAFNHKEILHIIQTLDISAATQALQAQQVQASRAGSVSRMSATPQPSTHAAPAPAPTPAVPSQLPAKRSAQSMIPSPDNLIALGRHNDPRDPYKKRA